MREKMRVTSEIITIKPKDTSIFDEDAATVQSESDGENVTSLAEHPAHAAVASQVDAWIEKNASKNASDEETKYIKNQIAWFFWLRRQRLAQIWLSTSAQARSK